MFKKFAAVLLGMLIFSTAVEAKRGLNLFAYAREAPATEFYGSDGSKHKISDYKGDFVLMIFWSRTCVPCIKELDNLNTFVKKTQNDGIKVILISKADEWADSNQQRAFLNKYKAPDLDFYLDEKGKLTEDFGIFASPHTVLINKSGEEIGRIRGSVEWDDEDVIEYIYKLKAQHG